MSSDPKNSERRQILEPEILPPERPGRQFRFESFEFRAGEGAYGSRMVRIGPLKLILWALGLLAAAALLLFIFAGALLIILPAAALVSAAAIGWLRLRRWWSGRR